MPDIAPSRALLALALAFVFAVIVLRMVER